MTVSKCWRWVALLAALCFTLSPAAALAAPPDTAAAALPQITIGIQADLSGSHANVGQQQLNAITLAAQQVNEAGGLEVGGTLYEISVISADGQCTADGGVAAAATLLAQHPLAVIGDTCSVSTAAVLDTYQAAGVPLISGTASRSDLTDVAHSYFFRTINRNDAPARELARHFRHWLGLSRVGVIQQPWAEAIESTDGFAQAFTALGGTTLGPIRLISNADFGTAVTTLASLGAQAIFFADGDATAAGQLSVIASGAGIAVFGWDTIENPLTGYAEAAGAAVADDWAATSSRQVDEMPGYVALHNAYVARAFPNEGSDITNLGVFTYDAARILFDAIFRAGVLDSAAVRDALAATRDFHGAAGMYTGFDANGDVIPQWSTLSSFSDGAPAAVQPTYVLVPLIVK